ncbi:phosphotransferase [Dehalococcoidia bacterium]|nr:phosphotransferase [Dehalococcoidia bacterium]
MTENKVKLRAIQHIRNCLDVEVFNVKPVSTWQQRQNTYRVTTSRGSYALRLFPPKSNIFTRFASMLFGRMGLNNQLRILESVEGLKLNNFKIPKFILTDHRSFTLTEYIQQKTTHKSNDIEKRRLADALVEWAALDFELYHSPREKFMQFIRNKLAIVVVLRKLPHIAQACGITSAFRSMTSTTKCWYRSQGNSRSTKWLEHGDFVESNVFVSQEGDIYFVDFESSSRKDSGRFNDIVMHSVDYGEEGIIVDWELIECFVDALLQSHDDKEITKKYQTFLINDLRLALLSRTIHYVAKYDRNCGTSDKALRDKMILISLLDGEKFRSTITTKHFYRYPISQ